MSTRLSGIKDSLNAKRQRTVKDSLSENLRRIQVKDIVREVEDYLKIYSSAVMDISWYVEGILYSFKDSQRWQYSDYLVTLRRRTSETYAFL
ncbi:hypothetical protein Tco_0339255 [Tanacetum coccineum]